MESFDAEGTFNEDYLWFYETALTAERNRQEAAEIVETLKLDAWLAAAGFTNREFSDRLGLPLRFDSLRLVAVAVRE